MTLGARVESEKILNLETSIRFEGQVGSCSYFCMVTSPTRDRGSPRLQFLERRLCNKTYELHFVSTWELNQ